jgi:hypothetical protein
MLSAPMNGVTGGTRGRSIDDRRGSEAPSRMPSRSPSRGPANAVQSRCRNHRLESRMRENRTYGSEGGVGESRSRPLSGKGCVERFFHHVHPTLHDSFTYPIPAVERGRAKEPQHHLPKAGLGRELSDICHSFHAGYSVSIFLTATYAVSSL